MRPLNTIHVRNMLALCLLMLLGACQDTIPKRSTITPGSTKDNDEVVCPEGQVLVEKTEGEEKFQICEEKPITRPDNAVFWKSDFCVCKDKKPVSYGNCGAICSNKDTKGAEILYGNFTVTEAISMSGLNNLQAWCQTPLPNDESNPECELQAKDEDGNITPLDVSFTPNSNSLTSNLQGTLSYDKTYVLTLVEKVSGAKSNSIQLVKFSPDTGIPMLGPLKTVPVTQYSCIVRPDPLVDDVTGDVYYENAYRLHFYFVPRVPPSPVDPKNSILICHDYMNPLWGIIDREEAPRLEQLPGVFTLWDVTDPRFHDNNNNTFVDVDEAIIQKTRNFGGTLSDNAKFFHEFKWMGPPEVEGQSGNNSNSSQPMGFFMAPWVDQSNYKSYCLTSSHYNSDNPLFKAFRDIIGVDTEGLYVGEKGPEVIIDGNGNASSGLPDYVLIRETDLKQVWFYLKANVPTAPTEENVIDKAVYFYYPLNKASPFVKSSTQRIYRVKGAWELNGGSNNGSTSSGMPSSFPPHDRKLGCIPKL
jgi:hypothetical protein